MIEKEGPTKRLEHQRFFCWACQVQGVGLLFTELRRGDKKGGVECLV